MNIGLCSKQVATGTHATPIRVQQSLRTDIENFSANLDKGSQDGQRTSGFCQLGSSSSEDGRLGEGSADR